MMMPQSPTGLTGEVSPRRLWVSRHYSLDDVKLARKSLQGVTINDIVLASVAYGFTELLKSRGEDPNGRTLRAVMPVSLRRNLDANNQVSILPAPLPLGDVEPLQRMKMIKKSTKHAKNSSIPVITEALRQATEKVTPAPIEKYVLQWSSSSLGYFSETLVTNVPGPMIPLYFMGRQCRGSMPIIPIEGSMRIIVGITSFEHDLNIGITGDGEHARDVDILADGILAGFAQICELAAQRRATAGHKQAAAAAAQAKKREATSRARSRKSALPAKPGKRKRVAKAAKKSTVAAAGSVKKRTTAKSKPAKKRSSNASK
jgi:hypothetical protein